MLKTKNRAQNKWFIFLLILAMTIVIIAMVAIRADEEMIGKTITIKYTAGTYENESPTGLFEERTAEATVTASGTLILPGEKFRDNIKDVNVADDAQLPGGETFYFSDTDGDYDYTNEWAYSFTGWKIVGATDKIPGETVFQPGDVIRPDVLAKYIDDDTTLTLEAVWGKCYFIQNPYETMVYSQILKVTDKTGANSKTLYVLNEDESENPTGAADTHKGNDPNKPKATIDGLYEEIRKDRGDTNESQRENPLSYDAYSTVVMLVGDLDYYTDSYQPEAKYYGYANEYEDAGKAIANTVNENTVVPVTATYKSLQEGNYTYNYKPKGYASIVYGNIRFDNVNFYVKKDQWLIDPDGENITKNQQSNSAEFLLSHQTPNNSRTSYLEFTARYNRDADKDGRTNAASTCRPNITDYVVINGGKFSGVQNQYTSTSVWGTTLNWTIGRMANITTVTCGTTSTYEDNFLNLWHDYSVYILGGTIQDFFGGNFGVNSIAAGERKITLLGDGEGSTEYDPKVSNLYGGAAQARLFSNIQLIAKNCTNLVNVYGGGRDYTATTYGKITIQLINCKLSGDLFGGGKNGNCEIMPETYLQYSLDEHNQIIGKSTPMAELMKKAIQQEKYSEFQNSLPKNSTETESGCGTVDITLQGTTVKGNVFGSGMGASQVVEVRIQYVLSRNIWGAAYNEIGKDDNVYPDSERNSNFPKEDDWLKPVTDYPKYNETDGRVAVYGYRSGSYTSNSPESMSYFTNHFYAYLSLATVQNVNIQIIDNSTIKGNVYGGGSIAKVLGDVNITITNSTVSQNVYGGGDGVTEPEKVNVYQPDDKEEYKHPYYTGTKTGEIWSITWYEQVPSPKKNKNGIVESKQDEYVEYTWSGDISLLDEPTKGIDPDKKLLYSPNTEGLGSVAGNVTVTIENSTVSQNVYGGGNYGIVFGDTSVTIQDTVTIGKVFGGGNGSSEDSTATLGAVKGKATLSISGGKITEAYGGGNYGIVFGDTSVTIQDTVTIGKVFGGGNGDKDATMENATAILGAVQGNSTLTILGGTITEAYGGGNAADIGVKEADGKVTGGKVTLDIQGGTITNAYGGNNEKGNIQGEIITTLSDNGKIVQKLFGGGNKADYNGITNLTISGGEVGAIDSEQNQDGTVNGSAYGGGNLATVLGTKVTVTGGIIRSLFGGSYGADITGYGTKLSEDTFGPAESGTIEAHVAITVDITGGNITTFLGGNDQSGDVKGDIIINVGDKNATASQESESPYIRNFFGGGNKAAYTYGETWTPNLSLRNNLTQDSNYQGIRIFLHSGKIYQVFGGGVLANVTNTVVSVRGGTYNFIYGGGFQANVTNSAVHVQKNATVSGDWLKKDQKDLPNDQQGGYVFGGGYEGYVKFSNIHISGGTIEHSVFGGGNKAGVGYSTVVIKDGTIRGSVYGGGYEGSAGYDENGNPLSEIVVEDGNNIGKIEPGTYVEITGGSIGEWVLGSTTSNTYIGNIYGGGYQGKCYETHVDVIEHRFDEGNTNKIKLGGSIFGGGHEALVETDTHIHVFQGTIEGNIYGGGRDGNVNDTCYVDIFAGTFGGNIYGGGKNGTANSTKVLISDDLKTLESLLEEYAAILKGYDFLNGDHQLTISGDVFGGGEGETATVYKDTIVLVDMKYGFTAEEKLDTTEPGEVSGQIKTSLTLDTQFKSEIKGSVYGGGDLGMVGNGSIVSGLNDANIVAAGNTKVEIQGGIIRGSVFGGGNGVPPENVRYHYGMGAVLGSTEVLFTGGYVETNVYGGGRQSRVYNKETNGYASCVKIEEKTNEKIAIGGSVFGGGDRGDSKTVNASIPTTLGNVKVEIIGLSNSSQTTQIFFIGHNDADGGVYGDGNLCIVKGTREVLLKDFNANTQTQTIADETPILLKTFYSLQRADIVTLDNSAIVLLGAKDLVAEDDSTIYSINRVGKLFMKNGSTFKLTEIVNYLGHLESDIETNRAFIDKGNNGSNGYTGHNGDAPKDKLTDDDIVNYQDNTTIDSTKKNTVCVANGLYLEIIQDEQDGKPVYGPVIGLFTLELLHANPGEGGGFVYGEIDRSTGDFICETKIGYTYEADTNVNQDTFSQNKHYIRKVGHGYELATSYDKNTIYYTREEVDGYMNVVDNVGGDINENKYSYYVWYIGGPTINYIADVTGYIGDSKTEFSTYKTLPEHTTQLNYVLFGVEGNEKLENALNNQDYTLVQKSTELTEQEIALELFRTTNNGKESLGFLYYESGTWKILKSEGSTPIAGYNGNSDKLKGNILAESWSVEKDSNRLSIVLYKSTIVNIETSDMQFVVDIDLYNAETNTIATGTSSLSFTINVDIVRLLPKQDMFYKEWKAYEGAPAQAEISITEQSSFTVTYHTKYFPSSYPAASGDMGWYLSVHPYTYYMDEAGHYITVDPSGNVINVPNGMTYIGEKKEGQEIKQNNIYKEGDNYYCQCKELNENALPMENKISYDSSYFPLHTRITMIDMTSSTPTYYYYLVETDNEKQIDLQDFKVMGTDTKISDLTDDKKPAFIKEYLKYQDANNSTTRVEESLTFIIDFLSVGEENWGGNVVHKLEFMLQHLYNPTSSTDTAAIDIMDYVEKSRTGDVTTYTRSAPKRMEYQVSMHSETGLEPLTVTFGDTSYYDKDTATINFTITKDSLWDNTLFNDGDFSLKIELLDENDNVVKFPVGLNIKSSDGESHHAGTNGTYIVLPLNGVGNYRFEIENLLFNLYSALMNDDLKPTNGTNNIAKFKLTLYVAPYAEYYDAMELASISEATYIINQNPTYTLNVGVTDENQIYALGNEVNLKIIAEDKNDESVSVSLEQKTTEGFKSYSLESLFNGSTTTISAGTQNPKWTINSGAEEGTYRLRFEYGDRIEYLYLIVTK